MFNISVLYPNKENTHFDFDYYLNTHMPRVIDYLSKGKGFQSVTVQKGITLDSPSIKSTFYVTTNYYFDTVENFKTAFLPHAGELLPHLKKFTNVEPIIQVNEVLIQKH